MSTEKEISLLPLINDIQRKINDRVKRMRPEYPLLVDYFDNEMGNLDRVRSNFISHNGMGEDYLIYFQNCTRIIHNLDAIEVGGFPYLWDYNLGKLIKIAMKNNLGLSNKWAKTLLVTNMLELSFNQVLMIHKKENFSDLIGSSITNKMKIINEILTAKGLTELDKPEIGLI